MLASSAPYLAVMDADLQHDEKLLPEMLETLKKGETEITVGSRYATGGGLGDWEQSRAFISRIATRLSRLILRANLTDPMSGFFMVRRDVFLQIVRNLSGIGFKILLDILVSAPRPLHFTELPYTFRRRHAGSSKLDSHAVWNYGMLLLDKLFGKIIPVRFVAFTLVGSLGVFVHLLTMMLLLQGLKMAFTPSQSIAALVAMTSNFALNNVLTYRDMRLTGWLWLHGWISFVLACSVGAFANVGIASYIFSNINRQWIIAALAGIMVSAVWNYAVSMVFTWRKPGQASLLVS
jgi:dolichol-phosphate mannosyltransferase